MKRNLFPTASVIILIAAYGLFSPVNARASQRGTEQADRQLLRLSDFDKCAPSCNSQLDLLEDQLEVGLRQAETFEKLFPEGTAQEEFLDQFITVLQNEIAQLEKVLSENQ